jgi:hypothetical protein
MQGMEVTGRIAPRNKCSHDIIKDIKVTEGVAECRKSGNRPAERNRVLEKATWQGKIR